ncbi:MAG: prolipoprotein diacylglyceryl transferase [Planctomycetota bacterium]|nr:prolipoprotein diacylglyceryl transferase [Planctomycetota bacterium]MDI6786828.1 prolipoprotein diacylglyceryl transferase [Planctomycetota bacterium]
MSPKLFEIPLVHLPIYSYGFMVMVGFLSAIFIASRRADRDNISPELIFDIGLIAMISGIIGARIFHIIYFRDHFDFTLFDISDGGMNIIAAAVGFFIPFIIHLKSKKHGTGSLRSLQAGNNIFAFNTVIKILFLSFLTAILSGRFIHLLLHRNEYDWHIFYVWQGGLVFYGGVILAVIAIIVYLKNRKIPILKTGDLLMPVILLGLAFGRIGCFLNGCCYGKIVSSFTWAAYFPIIRDKNHVIIGSPAYIHHRNQHLIPTDSQLSLPVHPTQIYEAILGIILFIILSIIWAKKRCFNTDIEPKHGFGIAYAGMLYALGRFTIELFRGDNDSFISGLSYSQLVSMGLFIIGVGLFIYLKIRPPVTSHQHTNNIKVG